MDGLITWLIAMKPLWFLAAWLASSVFGAFVALEKNRCGFCWFAMGVLFGPLALIATVGLPVKLARPIAPSRPDVPGTHANAPVGHASGGHAPAAHAAAHTPAPAAHQHPPAAHHAHVAHPASAHPPSPGHPSHAPTAHPAVAHALHAAAHPPTAHAAAHHADAAHAPAKLGFLASAMERPAAGIAVAAVVVLLLLIYFGSLHL